MARASSPLPVSKRAWRDRQISNLCRVSKSLPKSPFWGLLPWSYRGKCEGDGLSALLYRAYRQPVVL
jgi:hypothetical protein